MRWVHALIVGLTIALVLAPVVVSAQDNPYWIYEQSCQLRAEGHNWAAIQGFSLVVSRWPDSPPAPLSQYELAQTLFTICQEQQGLAELDRLMSRYPGSSSYQRAMLVSGQHLLQADEHERGIALLSGCVELNPTTEVSVEARYTLACLEEADSLVESAAAHFGELSRITSGPGSEWGLKSRYRLGVLLANQGRHQDAVAVLSDLLESQPEYGIEPAVRFELALSLLQLGQVDEAKRHLGIVTRDYGNCEYIKSAKAILEGLH